MLQVGRSMFQNDQFSRVCPVLKNLILFLLACKRQLALAQPVVPLARCGDHHAMLALHLVPVVWLSRGPLLEALLFWHSDLVTGVLPHPLTFSTEISTPDPHVGFGHGTYGFY